MSLDRDNMARRIRVLIVACAAIACLGLALLQPAWGQTCEPADALQGELQYLRRLSLDFRGDPPSMDELEATVKAGKVSDELIDTIIGAEGVFARLRAYHRDLLWANVSNIALSNGSFIFQNNANAGDGDGVTKPLWVRTGSRPFVYRNPQRKGNRRVGCLDEPVRRDGQGLILTKPHPDDAEMRQEGYVMVRPYWDPSKALKVCAFDAQSALAPKVGDITYDCKSQVVQSCGCGPNLRHCESQRARTRATIEAALAEQTLRLAEQIVRNKRPYTDILLARQIPLNGPILHYLRYQIRSGVGGVFFGREDQAIDLDAFQLSYTEPNRWVEVTGQGPHSGVLTLPLFLMRFASNRARAHRFYNAFVCRQFEAPPGGLPDGDDPCNDEPDLKLRCGCKTCHTTLEPLAASWGRWAESGLARLGESQFPRVSEDCKLDKNSRREDCRALYLVPKSSLHDKERPHVGSLRAYVFANAEMEAAIAAGPRASAEKAIDSGQFTTCTVRKLWGFFVGNTALSLRDETIDALAKRFSERRYNLLDLLRAIATSDDYRKGRVPPPEGDDDA